MNTWFLTPQFKKTAIVRPFCLFSFSQYGCRQSSCTSGSALSTARALQRSLPPSHFSYGPLLLILGILLAEGEAAQIALHCQMTHQQWEHCPSCSRGKAITAMTTLHILQSLLLHLCVKHFGYPPGWLLWERQIFMKSDVNHFIRHVMGLSEFHNTLLLIILQFWGNISNGSLCVEVSPICRHRWFLLLWSLLISVFSSRPCHGRPSWQFPEFS